MIRILEWMFAAATTLIMIIAGITLIYIAIVSIYDDLRGE